MNIVIRIEKAREELIKIGNEKGLQDPLVIKQSEVLDELINQYYRVERKPSEEKAS